MLPLVLLISAQAALGVPAGQIVDKVTCASEPSQSYTLYLPAAYTPTRAWPVILGFDPGGRGRNPVERYEAAAEKYGFIVAGSNNSRNGLATTGQAVSAMMADVESRFRVDPSRVYTAGMSGGSRVALEVALESHMIAGVMASSAGYLDGRARKTLDFPIFATAGTEDFNHLEMRQLDRALTTPHRLMVFEGGHQWLSEDLATTAVEWMELQAMKTGREPRNDAEIDAIFAKRLAAVSTGATDTATAEALQWIAEDFQGLKDVSAIAAKAATLARDKTVRANVKAERDADDREEALLREMATAEGRLASEDDRNIALAELGRDWKDLATKAAAPADSLDRRLARRVIAQLSASVTTKDPDYLKVINQYRTGRGGR